MATTEHITDDELKQMHAVIAVLQEVQIEYNKAEAKLISAKIAHEAMNETFTVRYEMKQGDVIRNDGRIIRAETPSTE